MVYTVILFSGSFRIWRRVVGSRGQTRRREGNQPGQQQCQRDGAQRPTRPEGSAARPPWL